LGGGGDGGAGGAGATSGVSGTVNTGGGGGGAGSSDTTGVNQAGGGAGGSGVVILAYANTYSDLTSVAVGLICNGTAGNITSDQVSRAGYKIYTFTAGTGNISW
jgi:hypothetical protein